MILRHVVIIATMMLCSTAKAGVIILPAKNPTAGNTIPLPFVRYDIGAEPQPFDTLTLSVPSIGMSYAEMQLFPADGAADVQVTSKTLDGDEVSSIFGLPTEGLWVSALATDGDTLSTVTMNSIYGQIGTVGGVSVSVPFALPVTELNSRSMAAIAAATVLLFMRGASRTVGV